MKLVKSNPQTAPAVETLSLDDYVSDGQSKNTLYARVSGDSMNDVGISDGDIAIVEKDRKPKENDAVFCRIENVFTIKTYSEIQRFTNPLRLVARNGEPIESGRFIESVSVLGVVTHVLKPVARF